MPVIAFNEWVPDAADLGNPGSIGIVNAVPSLTSYRSHPSLSVTSSTLTDYPRGAIEAVDSANNVYQYAGDETNLYSLIGSTWTDISKVATTYSTGALERWASKAVEFIVQLGVDSGGTSPTLDVDVEIDTVEGFGSPTVVASSQQLAGGSAGDRVQLNCTLPEGTNQRYLRLNYTLGGTSPTYTITAGIVAADQTNVVPGA